MDSYIEKLEAPVLDLVHLPAEILDKILTYLTEPSDLFSCRAVCWSWHHAATQIITSLPNLLLRRIVTRIHKHASRSSSTYHSRYSINAHRGWFLICQSENKNVVLYNPISRQNIKLPQLPDKDPDLRVRFITSSVPTDHNCIVLVCYYYYYYYYSKPKCERFVYCSPGDKNWTPVHYSCIYEYEDIRDMICYKGIFYALGSVRFIRFNLACISPSVNTVSRLIPNYARYLVESPCKDLLMVETSMRGIRFFKMIWGTDKCEWEEMECKLGESVSIFLAPCDSMFMSITKDDYEYRSNCLYLYDDSCKNLMPSAWCLVDVH